MRSIRINGEEQSIEDHSTIAELVATLTPHTRGVAVAVDASVLPQEQWQKTIEELNPQRIDILTAVQGG